MSQDGFNSGTIVIFMWIITISLSIGSGVLSWNWIKPVSFFGAIGFIVLWGILSRISHFIAFGILMVLLNKN